MTSLGNVIVGALGIVSVVYLCELLPNHWEIFDDSKQYIGSIDDASASAILFACLAYFNIIDTKALLYRDKRKPIYDFVALFLLLISILYTLNHTWGVELIPDGMMLIGWMDDTGTYMYNHAHQYFLTIRFLLLGGEYVLIKFRSNKLIKKLIKKPHYKTHTRKYTRTHTTAMHFLLFICLQHFGIVDISTLFSSFNNTKRE